MAYLDYPGLAYFKSLLDQTYLRVDYDGDTTIAGNVTFTNPITGDIDGRAKKDWLGQQFDTTYLKDIQPDESGALKLILGNGQVSHLVTDTTVTQERSSANETYPVLLCYDENATADQIAKKVKYGHDVQINPAYGYIYAQGYVEKHPAYNRIAAQSSRAEWMFDFRDSVLNPVGQIYSYVDPSNQGGEHRMEFRLYGNPHTTSLNLPNYNFETDTVSLGVSSTKGDKLTFFGYAPSTPIYLENGTTMRKSTVRGDQYGRDIITRDWLNLNGSITGLVHTYMDETIDGYKTFLKTVTIDSGNDNAKAGLNVQGDVNIDSGDNTKPSNFYVQGNSHIHGNEDIDGNLNVDGISDQHGNVHMYNNLTVDKNATITGNETVGGTLTVANKITGNGGAEISGSSGLKVNGNETVTGNLTVGGTTTTEDLSVTDDATIGDDLTVNGDTNVAGTINKKTGNTTQEYVTYITNQADTRKNIAANLVDTTKGLAYNSSTGKIYINAANNKGIAFDSSGKAYVDFSQIDDNTKAAILDGLDIQIPLKTNIDLIVNPGASNDTDSYALDYNTRVATPFTTIQKAVTWASSKLALGTKNVFIKIANGIYHESVSLPEVNTSSGSIELLPLTDGGSVSITSPVNSNGCYPHCVYASSGACKWTLRHISFDLRFGINTGSGAHTASCVLSGIDGAIINLIGCNFFLAPELVNGSRRTEITGGPQACSLINADGGTINLYPDDSESAVTFYLPEINTAGVSITVLNAARNGRIAFRRRASATNGEYTCKGSCNIFMHAWQGGNTALIGSNGAQTHFVVASGETVTGKKYVVETGAYVLAPSGGFPGDAEGSTVDTTKACWISGV